VGVGVGRSRGRVWGRVVKRERVGVMMMMKRKKKRRRRRKKKKKKRKRMKGMRKD
jgi:hypothetical protein